MGLSLSDLPDDIDALKALVLAAHAANAKLAVSRDHLAQTRTILATEMVRLTAPNERLDHIISVLRRALFGRSSERIMDDQLKLALDDVEVVIAAEDRQAENAHEIVKEQGALRRRTNRGQLPADLLREEVVIEPEAQSCPCCGGGLHVLGEDTSERLDRVPAKLRVISVARSTGSNFGLPSCCARFELRIYWTCRTSSVLHVRRTSCSNVPTRTPGRQQLISRLSPGTQRHA
jgi:transposase